MIHDVPSLYDQPPLRVVLELVRSQLVRDITSPMLECHLDVGVGRAAGNDAL